MTIRAMVHKVAAHDGLNFFITNHIPRSLLTRGLGWFSKVEHPLVRKASIGVWKFFSDLDLDEAKQTHFKSVHACFTRELKEGARPIDTREHIAVSPSDGIVGACGRIDNDTLLQAKGMPYSLRELLQDAALADQYIEGTYVTLRLTSSMYHRFHSPHDCTIEHITYVAGEAFNVNPPALKRIAQLFCKNERAVIRTRQTNSNHLITLVPVAAVLVASIRLRFLNVLLHLKYRGPTEIPCHHVARKGEELGWFEHGSTIIVLVPKGFSLCDDIQEGTVVRMGQALLQSLD